MEPGEFRYTPRCSTPGCGRPAVYKVAASWSDGTSWELKHYGLACDEHRMSQLSIARIHREGLALVEGEALGEVALFELKPGIRDAELKRLANH